jgi:hypothetical protein
MVAITHIIMGSSKNSSPTYIDNYLSFRAKLEQHQQFDKETVRNIKRVCEQMMQNYPILFQKIFSGDPELLQQAKREIDLMIYEQEEEYPSSAS